MKRQTLETPKAIALEKYKKARKDSNLKSEKTNILKDFSTRIDKNPQKMGQVSILPQTQPDQLIDNNNRNNKNSSLTTTNMLGKSNPTDPEIKATFNNNHKAISNNPLPSSNASVVKQVVPYDKKTASKHTTKVLARSISSNKNEVNEKKIFASVTTSVASINPKDPLLDHSTEQTATPNNVLAIRASTLNSKNPTKPIHELPIENASGKERAAKIANKITPHLRQEKSKEEPNEKFSFDSFSLKTCSQKQLKPELTATSAPALPKANTLKKAASREDKVSSLRNEHKPTLDNKLLTPVKTKAKSQKPLTKELPKNTFNLMDVVGSIENLHNMGKKLPTAAPETSIASNNHNKVVSTNHTSALATISKINNYATKNTEPTLKHQLSVEAHRKIGLSIHKMHELLLRFQQEQAALEKSMNGFNISLCPMDISEINAEDEFLNSLTRLFVSQKDVCIATCKYEGKVFIASNGLKPQLATKIFTELKKYINHDTVDLNKLIFNSVAEKINSLISNVRRYEPSKKALDMITAKYINELLTKENIYISDLIDLYNCANKTDSRDLRSAVSNIYDLCAVLKYLDKNPDIKNLFTDNQDDNFVLLENAQTKHAEIVILDHMLKNYLDKLKDSNQKIYIALSKFSCAGCNAMITMPKEWGKYFYVEGTHGYFYDGVYKGPDRLKESPEVAANAVEIFQQLWNDRPTTAQRKIRDNNSCERGPLDIKDFYGPFDNDNDNDNDNTLAGDVINYYDPAVGW